MGVAMTWRDVLAPLMVAGAAAVVWIVLELEARRYRRRLDGLERRGDGTYLRRLTDDERRAARELYGDLHNHAATTGKGADDGPHDR